MATVSVKVSGNIRDIAEFVEVLETTFLMMIRSRVCKNDRTPGYHQFLDVNPYVKKEPSNERR